MGQHADLYKSAAWQKIRAQQLREHPLCARCLVSGRVEYAQVVHHRVRHDGRWELFARKSNLESICKAHHDGDAQREEVRGYSSAIGSDGWPTDPRHPANRPAGDIEGAGGPFDA